MELAVLWTLTGIALLNALQVSGDLPLPVLQFEETIIEDDDTTVTCTFPSRDFHDVKLTIKANMTAMTDCAQKAGDLPSVACTAEVTRHMHQMEFTCEAEFKTQSLPQKMNLQTEPTITDCPDTLKWFEGQTTSFQCNATGYPQPNVTCGKSNTIYRDRETFTATRNMSGKYTCKAVNFDSVTKSVYVTVEHKPKVLGVRVGGSLHNKGDEVEITCNADGDPDPTFRWKTPSADVQFSPNNQTVIIRSLQESHLGAYKCTAQNKHGADAAETTLELAIKPSVTLTITPSSEVLEGDNVTLACEASGFPPPVLSWNIPGNKKISNKSSFAIQGVQKGHLGSYECTAQNKHGSDTQRQQLTMGVKPKIDQIRAQPSNAVSEGANVTLTCVAEGAPPPTYTWKHSATNVTYSPDKRALYIRGAKKSHEGNYECKVQNKHGSSKVTVTVKVQESKGSKAERRRPSTATLLATLITSSVLYYLC